MWVGACRRQVGFRSHDAEGPAEPITMRALSHRFRVRTPFCHQAGDEDGQATVELAIVAIVLFTMIFGALEVGRGLNTWVIVTQAAREGARTAATRCTIDPGCSTAVDTRVTASLTGINPDDADWGLDPGPYQSGNSVSVWVEYEMVPVTPLIAALIPGGVLTVRGETTMRLE